MSLASGLQITREGDRVNLLLKPVQARALLRLLIGASTNTPDEREFLFVLLEMLAERDE